MWCSPLRSVFEHSGYGQFDLRHDTCISAAFYQLPRDELDRLPRSDIASWQDRTKGGAVVARKIASIILIAAISYACFWAAWQWF